MRRAILLVSLLMLTTVGASLPDSTVKLKVERKLADFDLGIQGGEVSPNGSHVLLYGVEGYAHLISAENAGDENMDVILEKETTQDLNDVTWHPGGLSAVFVGDSGTVLRFNSTNYALGEAEGSSVMAGKDINAVQFTPGSSVAYLGTEDGEIWRYYANTFSLLDSQASSRISDIDCLQNDNICVVTTLNDGIAVIDQGDTVSWIADTKSHTWMGVGCEDPRINSCSVFGSGKKVSIVNIDIIDTSQSELGEIIVLGQLTGDFTGDNPGSNFASIISLGPLGMVRWTQFSNEAFLMFENEDAAGLDVFLSADRYAVSWENSENSGFLVTGQGGVVSFEPLSEDVEDEFPEFLAYLLVVCVFGVFFGMIYWNSPWLQRKYANLTNRNKRNEQ